jgi:hypothetical protein
VGEDCGGGDIDGDDESDKSSIANESNIDTVVVSVTTVVAFLSWTTSCALLLDDESGKEETMPHLLTNNVIQGGGRYTNIQ